MKPTKEEIQAALDALDRMRECNHSTESEYLRDIEAIKKALDAFWERELDEIKNLRML